MAAKQIDNPVSLINMFAARCFIDFFDHDEHVERMKSFLRKQLRKVKIPWIEHIVVTNLDLGDRLPEIKDILRSWIDEHGLWSHLRISYDGKLQLTLNVKLKWIRKNRPNHRYTEEPVPLTSPKGQTKKEQQHPPIRRSWRQRLWPPRHWFQRHRSLSKPSHSAKPEHTVPEKSTPQEPYASPLTSKVTKTTLVIKFEVNNLHGILLFNIPPLPSDRLWISFLDMPEMQFSATPHLGEYRVPFYKIEKKLEKKLRQTFRRYLVMPNMKDVIIPTTKDYLGDNGYISIMLADVKGKEHTGPILVAE